MAQSIKLPELLAPAGNMEKLRAAFAFGADAAYVGLKTLNLRNFAENFTLDELHCACAFAHSLGKRIYVTLNAFARDDELSDLPKLLGDIAAAGADAVIIADPGVFALARSSGLKLHISTQANTLNSHAAQFWQEQGASRVILARELALSEIAAMRKSLPQLELEVFVHGAMCMSYSGRCLISNYLTGRDANKGECAQPCRWVYELREKGKQDEWLTLEEDERGSYVFNSRDMMLIEHLPKLIAAGVDSFKIEGRMKSAYYVATVVNAYRMALDAYAAAAEAGEKFTMDSAIISELYKVSHRPYFTGFLLGEQSAKQAVDAGGYTQERFFAAQVLSYDQRAKRALLEQRNRFYEGDVLEVLTPGVLGRSIRVSGMTDEEGAQQQCAPHPKQRLLIDCGESLKPGDFLRKQMSD